MEKRQIQLFGNRRGKSRELRFVGRIAWEAEKGLRFDVPGPQLRSALRTLIRARIREGQYYISAAVRTGVRVSGLRFDRIDASVPEILRCIAADEELWSKSYAGCRVTPVYQEAS